MGVINPSTSETILLKERLDFTWTLRMAPFGQDPKMDLATDAEKPFMPKHFLAALQHLPFITFHVDLDAFWNRRPSTFHKQIPCHALHRNGLLSTSDPPAQKEARGSKRVPSLDQLSNPVLIPQGIRKKQHIVRNSQFLESGPVQGTGLESVAPTRLADQAGEQTGIKTDIGTDIPDNVSRIQPDKQRILKSPFIPRPVTASRKKPIDPNPAAEIPDRDQNPSSPQVAH
jgi:hypothetical protein